MSTVTREVAAARIKDYMSILAAARHAQIAPEPVASNGLAEFGKRLHTCAVCGKSAEFSLTWNKLFGACTDLDALYVSGVCTKCEEPKHNGDAVQPDWEEHALRMNFDIPDEVLQDLTNAYMEVELTRVPEGTMLVIDPHSWSPYGPNQAIYFWKVPGHVRRAVLPRHDIPPRDGALIVQPDMKADVLRIYSLLGEGEYEVASSLELGNAIYMVIGEKHA